MVSSFAFLPQFEADKIEPQTAPRVAVGAVSPLWLMFGGAVAAGATYWWWASRWREAVNLEAVIALAPEPVAPATHAEEVLETAPEPIVEAVTEMVDAAEVMMDAAEEALETLAEAAAATLEPVSEAVVDAVDEAVEATEAAAEVEPAMVEPMVEAASTPSDAVAKVEAGDGDDLTRLVGVGPKLAASLTELGVTRFSQIAAWTAEELAEIDLKLGLKGRADRDAWIAQAKRLAAGAETETV